MVVGNKIDLVVDSPNSTQVCHISSHQKRIKYCNIFISGTKGYFIARSQALEIGLCGVFCKVSSKFFSITFEKVY
jgi:hypothetical protein